MGKPLSQQFPDIYLKHAKEIENMSTSAFKESDFFQLRTQQRFEISTFNMIKYFFKSRHSDLSNGSKIIGNVNFTGPVNKQLHCDVLSPIFVSRFNIFHEETSDFTFKSVQKFDYFYQNFKYSPVPVIICPSNTVEEVRDFTSSCLGFLSCNDETVYLFTHGNYELVVMEPFVASNFGLLDEVISFVSDERIKTFYIAFLYEKTL